jgi:CheY-like chemotaxis protein
MEEHPLLIIEDDPADRSLLLEALKDHGFRHPIFAIGDGEEAVEFLSGRGNYVRPHGGENAPVMVVLDLELPKLGGLAVLRHMRGNRWLRYVPVLVLTTGASAANRSEALEGGANFFLPKPDSPDGYRRVARVIADLLSFL